MLSTFFHDGLRLFVHKQHTHLSHVHSPIYKNHCLFWLAHKLRAGSIPSYYVYANESVDKTSYLPMYLHNGFQQGFTHSHSHFYRIPNFTKVSLPPDNFFKFCINCRFRNQLLYYPNFKLWKLKLFLIRKD